MKSLFIFLALTICFNVHAETNPFTELSQYSARIVSVPQEKNPFHEGTQKIVLTEQDKATLAEYAFNSKTLLERALRKATGKDLDESHEIYVEAIERVVIDSFADKRRSELLMRHALNQALQLTVGIPTADGKAIQEHGILADVDNKDVVTFILEDSIRLAIRYYETDVRAIKTGDLVKLPYIQFGNEHLSLAQNWSHAIHQPELLLSFQVTVLEQWMSTVANHEVLDRLKIAEAILDVDSALASVKTAKYTTLQKIRYLRGVVDTLFDTLRRLGYTVADSAPALSPTTSNQEFIVAIDQAEVDGFSSLSLIKKSDTGLIVGQGYSSLYYYRGLDIPKAKGYKDATEAKFRELLTTKCAEINPGLAKRVVCVPMQRIPRSYKYISNAEFQDQFTVQLVLGLYAAE